MAKKILMAAVIILIILFLCIKPVLRQLYPIQNKKTVECYSKEYSLDPRLVYSVIKAESKFNPYATSSKGARGLMQITPSTGGYIAELLGEEAFSDNLLYDKETNIRYGCYYLSKLLDDFQGNLILALAAYNGGEGNVRKWLEGYEDNDDFTIEAIPFRETRRYVRNVMNNYDVYKYLYHKG